MDRKEKWAGPFNFWLLGYPVGDFTPPTTFASVHDLDAANEQEIGTQEAADILGVSRPYLVKLLDAMAQ